MLTDNSMPQKANFLFKRTALKQFGFGPIISGSCRNCTKNLVPVEVTAMDDGNTGIDEVFDPVSNHEMILLNDTC